MRKDLGEWNLCELGQLDFGATLAVLEQLSGFGSNFCTFWSNFWDLGATNQFPPNSKLRTDATVLFPKQKAAPRKLREADKLSSS